MRQRPAATQLMLVPDKRELLRDAKTRSRKVVWRRWLVPFTLILVELWLSLVVWAASIVLHRIWGYNEPYSQTTIVAIITMIIAWVGLRALLGLYPGYGLGSAELLRRHTYATTKGRL
jgi:hypothetical protein